MPLSCSAISISSTRKSCCRVINMLMRGGAKSLLLVGDKFSETVINFILNNKKPEKFRIVAAKTPGNTDDERRAHLS